MVPSSKVVSRFVWKFGVASSGPPCRYVVETDNNRGPVSFRPMNVHSRIALAWSKYVYLGLPRVRTFVVSSTEYVVRLESTLRPSRSVGSLIFKRLFSEDL